jgi:site-specific DNA-methyltransferase (adenine-specific)
MLTSARACSSSFVHTPLVFEGYPLTPASENSEGDHPTEFELWFQDHVTYGDVFTVLPTDSLKYDLIIVDPPYGITSEAWDKKDKFELLNFTRRWLNLVLQKLKPTGRLFVFWSREYLFDLKPLLDEIKSEYPLNFGGLIVWNFRNVLTVPNNRKEFKITWEPIFYFYGLEAPELNRPDSELSGEKWNNIDSDVWTFAIPQSNFSDKKIHPAQKPLDLYKHIINISTKANDLILDPFAGSGTTGHAAYELGREFNLIEANQEYIQAMSQRLKEVFHNGK